MIFPKNTNNMPLPTDEGKRQAEEYGRIMSEKI